MTLRVAVVEDDPMMRLALTSAVKLAGLELAFDSGSAAQAVASAKTQRIDAAVLDLHLGEGPTGADVARELRRLHPRVGIVFLTSFEDPRLLHSSIENLPAGSQYLTKGSLNEVGQILNAIQVSVSDEAQNTRYEIGGSLGRLSDSQVEILRLVAEGLSNAEIAKVRFIQEKSVEVAISRMAKALGLSIDAAQNQRVHIAQVYFRAIGKPVR